MKTIKISIQKSKISRAGETPKLIAVGSDGKITGLIRGLTGGRIHQLLNSEGITVDSAHEGRLIDLFAMKNIALTGEIETVRKGQPYSYSQSQLDSIGSITGRRTIDADPEPVVAGVEYVSGSDGYRITDFNSLQVELTIEQMKFFQSFKFNSPKATASLVDVLADDLIEE